MSFLTWIVLGLIAGFIASKIVDIAPRYRSGRSWCGRRWMAVSVLRRERGYRLEPVQSRGGCRWRGRRLDLVPRDSSHGLMGHFLSPGGRESRASGSGGSHSASLFVLIASCQGKAREVEVLIAHKGG